MKVDKTGATARKAKKAAGQRAIAHLAEPGFAVQRYAAWRSEWLHVEYAVSPEEGERRMKVLARKFGDEMRVVVR